MCIIIFSWLYRVDSQNRETTKLYFFDVGQGSGQLIRTKEGVDIVIDGGPSDMFVRQVQEVMPLHDRYIDIVIITHAHYDHITGLVRLLEIYDVGAVYVSTTEHESVTFQKVLDMVDEKVVHGPLIFTIDEDTFLEIVYPRKSVSQVTNLNNTSLISRFVDEEVSILFPGDAEGEVEQELVAQAVDIKANILVAPHHGSKTSSMPEFISKVQPEMIIIPVGENNKYGHPHAVTLTTYKTLNIPYLLTSQGTITMTIQDERYELVQ